MSRSKKILREVVAENLGYTKRRCWLRIPKYPGPTAGGTFVILTLPRATLKRGFATAKLMTAEVDYATLRHDGHAYRAKVKLLDVI